MIQWIPAVGSRRGEPPAILDARRPGGLGTRGNRDSDAQSLGPQAAARPAGLSESNEPAGSSNRQSAEKTGLGG